MMISDAMIAIDQRLSVHTFRSIIDCTFREVLLCEVQMLKLNGTLRLNRRLERCDFIRYDKGLLIFVHSELKREHEAIK